MNTFSYKLYDIDGPFDQTIVGESSIISVGDFKAKNAIKIGILEHYQMYKISISKNNKWTTLLDDQLIDFSICPLIRCQLARV